jgi:Holliday junction resolvasome RuvABC endonuclease subunit
MSTLGLDVSPLRIGWARVSDDGDPLDHGTITFDAKQWVTPGMRADALEDALGEKTVTQIGAEAVFIGPNKLGSIRAAMALGQVESICDYLWPDAKQKILTATQWRKLCDIPQRGKEPVMLWARDLCATTTEPETQDAADAIAIAYATLRWYTDE